MHAGETLHACIASTVAVDIRGLRRELLPWLQYHTELGVAHFYVRRMYRFAASASALVSYIAHVLLLF